MRILVPDDYQGAVCQLPCLQRMQGHDVQVLGALATDPDERAEQLADADALVLIRERTRVDAALLQRLPRLKLISQTGRVGAHVDVAACTQSGVAVAEGVGSPVAPAELTWALILAASRRLAEYQRALHQAVGRRWATLAWAVCCTAAPSVSGVTDASANAWPGSDAHSACRYWCGAAMRPARRLRATALRLRAAARNCLNVAMCCRCIGA
ncbi:lactate dehydrogenase-like 2-hydroxyacid dehydrogenase [Xanthomonas campestris]|nr:lactate dehydrogenase-like 2-hydroxyacid dehydrogenase [Xanthomonas cannabis]